MRGTVRRFVVGLVFVGFAAMMQGSSCLGVTPTIDEVTKTFNNALADLNAGSSQWQLTLTNLSNSLIAQGQQTLANQVQSVIDRGIAAAGIEVKCTVDFLRTRLGEAVRGILLGFQGKPVPPPVPHFCSADPIAIDLRLTPSQRMATLNVYGFNLSTHNVAVTVRNDNGAGANPQGFFNVPNEYSATFNLVDYPFNVHNQALIFRLPGGEEWTVGIVQAATCGGVGQPCCSAGTPCGPSTGCLASVCTTCPLPFVPKTTDLVRLSDESDGDNCGGVTNVHHYGGMCTSGTHREDCQVIPNNPPGGSSCVRSWRSANPADCGCDVVFHTPADCFKRIHCAVAITQTTNPPPHPDGCP
ncbi:MAG TPA: hypothetical protein VGD37_20390 [Kofleriaceae bacterium]|jgi:hypothetical protein